MDGFRWNRRLTGSASNVSSKKLWCGGGRRSGGDARCGEDEAGCRAVSDGGQQQARYHIKSMASVGVDGGANWRAAWSVLWWCSVDERAQGEMVLLSAQRVAARTSGMR
jgi:hypothetical protein